MKSRRSWWIVFGACAALVAVGLFWMTVEVVRLERAEIAARSEAAQQESLRLALWRMDSLFSPHLARESSRQYVDYRSFHPEELAYTKMLHRLEAQEVLTPSPLLSFESEFIRLHFETTPDGEITSPQVPVGNERDLVEATYVPGDRLAANTLALDALREMITPSKVVECVAYCEVATAPLVPAGEPGPPPTGRAQILEQQVAQQTRTQYEWGKRQQASINTNAPAPSQQWLAPPDETDAPATVTVEPLVPIWLEVANPDGAAPAEELIFVRRVRVGEVTILQGFLCDWPRLRAALLEVVGDLFPSAGLVPILGAPARVAGYTLATIPALLEVPAPPRPVVALMSPAHGIVALTWIAVLIGLVAVAATLRASILFGERRARFASAVTHELRTPLTTFRMYSEMLAEGMVVDEEQRQTYLYTLRDESDRLAALVENVLAYARLERGGARVERAETTLASLLESLRPPLDRQAERSGMRLDLDLADGATRLVTDADAVGQILLNLVENACKYAGEASDRTIHLDARAAGGEVLIDVRDHGPGVAPEHARGVFAPFERGARSSGDPTPGVGLGLALARGLARTLGGDLRLEARAAAGGGACFRLALPKA